MKTFEYEYPGCDAVPKGTIVVRKPNTGIRNESILATEWEPESAHKQFALAVHLLPRCIVNEPWLGQKTMDMYNNMETELSDELLKKFMSFLSDKKGDVVKKSDVQSGSEEITKPNPTKSE